MLWHEVAEEFAQDGALRDIYVFGTSVRDWQAVYDAVRTAYPVILHDNRSLPDDVRDLLDSEAVVTLTVDPSGLAINCHFFVEDEIEFDVCPNTVKTQTELDRLSEFLKLIGSAARKDVVLTPENSSESVILRYDWQRGVITRGQAG